MMITEKTFFWRFAMLPIVLPILCGLIIWLLEALVGLSGFLAGGLMFVAGSGLVGGVPYLLTIVAVFIYTRIPSTGNKDYARIGLFMPIIFVLFLHTIMLFLTVVDDIQSMRTAPFLQSNLNFLALDLLGLLVASVYTLAGWFLLRHLRKKNRIEETHS